MRGRVNRNWVNAVAALGLCKFHVGTIEGRSRRRTGDPPSPRDPRLPNWYWRIGMVHLLKARVGDAVSWLEEAPAPIRGRQGRAPGSPPPMHWQGNSETRNRRARRGSPAEWHNRYAIVLVSNAPNALGVEAPGFRRGDLFRRGA